MAASITAHLQIFKRPQLPHFSTDLDETAWYQNSWFIKIFHIKQVVIRVAIPFNGFDCRLSGVSIHV